MIHLTGAYAATIAGLAAVSGAASVSATTGWPLQLDAARLTQRGGDLRLRVVTSGPIRDWLRDARAGLCLSLSPSARRLRFCLSGKRAMRLDVLGPRGQVQTIAPFAGSVAVTGRNVVVLQIPLDRAGLGPGAIGWSVSSRWTGAGCFGSRPCTSRWPSQGTGRLTIASSNGAGCTARGEDLRYSGPPSGGEVALTFDDGPGLSTTRILNVLEQQQTVATFFVVGEHVQGSDALLGRMLHDGDAIGDHSYSHPVLSGDGVFAHWEIERTLSIVEAATGYQPCLFRAPYGDTSPALVADARAQGLLTIGWNVDPRDWSDPGVGSIVTTTMRQVRPGSIIELHDGGGDRAQTVAALPRIIAALRSRRLRPVTVPELLRLPA